MASRCEPGLFRSGLLPPARAAALPPPVPAAGPAVLAPLEVLRTHPRSPSGSPRRRVSGGTAPCQCQAAARTAVTLPTRWCCRWRHSRRSGNPGRACAPDETVHRVLPFGSRHLPRARNIDILAQSWSGVGARIRPCPDACRAFWSLPDAVAEQPEHPSSLCHTRPMWIRETGHPPKVTPGRGWLWLVPPAMAKRRSRQRTWAAGPSDSCASPLGPSPRAPFTSIATSSAESRPRRAAER